MQEDINRRLARLVPGLTRRYGVCGRKVPYATLEEVIAMLERCQARAGDALAWYRCPYGDHYHLTRQPPTPAQLAQLQTDATEHLQGMRAEVETYPARWEALMRAAEAIKQARDRGIKALHCLRPSRHIIDDFMGFYHQQREDLIRQFDLLEQLDELILRHNMLRAQLQAIRAPLDDMGAGIRAWRVRCEELQAAALDQRQALIAGLDRELAALDAGHAKNLAWARAYLSAKYFG